MTRIETEGVMTRDATTGMSLTDLENEMMIVPGTPERTLVIDPGRDLIDVTAAGIVTAAGVAVGRGPDHGPAGVARMIAAGGIITALVLLQCSLTYVETEHLSRFCFETDTGTKNYRRDRSEEATGRSKYVGEDGQAMSATQMVSSSFEHNGNLSPCSASVTPFSVTAAADANES